MESEDLKILYERSSEYFSSEFGFKPFRQKPDKIVVKKIINNKINKTIKNDVLFRRDHDWIIENDELVLKIIIIPQTKKITDRIIERFLVIKESILSFIPEIIRNNPLVNAMILYRATYGKTLIDPIYRDNGKELFDSYKESFEREMSNDFILISIFSSFPLIFPENYIENSFQQYIYTMASFAPILSVGSKLINAIIEDVGLKISLYKPLDFLETKLLSYFCSFFHIKRIPFTPESFLKYLKENILSADKKLLDSYLYLERIRDIINKFEKKGISFNYRIDYLSFGYMFVYFVIVFSDRADFRILSYFFDNLKSIFVFYNNYTFKNPIRAGIIIYNKSKQKFLNSFFESLKNFGIIRDFLLLEYDNLSNIVNIRDLINAREYREYLLIPKENNHFIESMRYSKKNIILPDYIDFIIFRLLTRSGTNGFWMRSSLSDLADRFREEIATEKNLINYKIISYNSLKKNLEKPINESLKELWIIILQDDKISVINSIDFSSILINKIGLLKSKILIKEIKKGIDFISYNNKSNYSKNDEISSFLDFYIIELLIGNKGKNEIKNWFLKKGGEKDALIYLRNIFDGIFEYIQFLSQNFDSYLFNKKIEILDNFMEFTNEQIKYILKKRLQKYNDTKILEPLLLNSLYVSGLNCIKILILKNISNDDDRIESFSMRIPYCSINYSQNLGDTHIIFIRIHTNMEGLIFNMISDLFQNHIIYYGSFIGSFYSQESKLELLYNPISSQFVDFDDNYNTILNILSEYQNTFFKSDIPKRSDDFSLFKKSVNSNNINEGYKESIKKIIQIKPEMYKLKVRKNPSTIEILKISNIFKDLLGNNPTKMEKNPYIKYFGIPNFSKFNLSYYILKFYSNNKTIPISNSRMVEAQEIFSVPGCFKIERPFEISNWNLNILHYIFPKESFCSNLIKYSIRRNLISDISLFKVSKLMINYFPNYFINYNGWNSNFSCFDVIWRQILENNMANNEPKYLVFDFESNSNIFYDGNSKEYNILKQIFQKNLSPILNLKSMIILKKMIEEKIVSILPNLDIECLGIDHRISLHLHNVNDEKINILLIIFSILPFVIIHDCWEFDDKYEKPNSKALIVDIFLPNDQLDKLYNSLIDLLEKLNLTNIQIFQNLTEVDISKYSNQKIRKLPNPYESHLWDKNNNYWKHLDYFDSEGRLKPHEEIIKMI